MQIFAPLVAAWTQAIQTADRIKQKRFGKDAQTGMKFLTGPYDFLYGPDGLATGTGGLTYQPTLDDPMSVPPKAPAFRLQVNKVSELVQLFLPVLYQNNPSRYCEPRRPVQIPMEILNRVAMLDPNQAQQILMLQQQGTAQDALDDIASYIKQIYLNSTPNPTDLKSQVRLSLVEALVKGAGVLWPEIYIPPGGSAKMVSSVHDTIDNLVYDSSMNTRANAKWYARRRVTSVYDFCRKFNLNPQEIKARAASQASQAWTTSGYQLSWMDRARESAYDLVVWWEVYSKCGLGNHFKSYMPPETRAFIDQFAPSDYVYLVVCESCPDYFANCPKEILNQPATPEVVQDITRRFQWPIPYWADGSWPCEVIAFHEIPNDPWPLSHIGPAMGELKFLNWFYSFIAGKILVTSRDFIAVKKKAMDALKDAIRNGSDLSIIELQDMDGKITDLVDFLQHPEINGDVFKIAAIIEASWEKRTGLTELLYGQSSRQYRSAAEAEIKSDAVNVRPEDMRLRTEESMAQIARLEAVAMRFALDGNDVAFTCGPVAGILWQQYGMTQPIQKSLFETTVRIESENIREPGRARDMENSSAFIQTFGPFFTSAAQMGYAAPFNAMMRDWARLRDVDPTPYLIPEQPPQQQPPAQQQAA